VACATAGGEGGGGARGPARSVVWVSSCRGPQTVNRDPLLSRARPALQGESSRGGVRLAGPARLSGQPRLHAVGRANGAWGRVWRRSGLVQTLTKYRGGRCSNRRDAGTGPPVGFCFLMKPAGLQSARWTPSGPCSSAGSAAIPHHKGILGPVASVSTASRLRGPSIFCMHGDEPWEADRRPSLERGRRQQTDEGSPFRGSHMH